MSTRRFIHTSLLALCLCSCGNGTSSQTADENRLIKILPSGVEISDMKEATVPAQFTSDDFRWMGGNLSMTVFQEILYDAVDINQMKVGDTLQYQDQDLVIKELVAEDGSISVNGGLEEGGAWLMAHEGGTYRAYQFDDHSIYRRLGTAELPLSEDLAIIDCGDNPTDKNDTITTDQKLYIENLQGYRKEFSPLNTSVTIENGLITSITRRWIP